MTGTDQRTTLVVGASRGLGRGIALAFATAGDSVVALSRGNCPDAFLTDPRFRKRIVGNGFYGGGMADTSWEPPVAGNEVEHLIGALERLRTTFRYKADGLDSAALQQRMGASSLTLGGLLKHLAVQEDYLWTPKVSGEALGAPWESNGWADDDDWEFTSAADNTPEELYAFWDGAVERSRARLAAALPNGGLDQEVHASFADGRHANLRRLLFDQLEEYGRHTGQADLLREAIDGRTGEDPPADWKPESGNYRLPG